MKTIDDLTTPEQMQALQNFRAAVAARQNQWNHERCIEQLLGGEIELSIEDYAAGCDTPETLSLNDLREALTDSEKEAR